jgi:hypothetical protein
MLPGFIPGANMEFVPMWTLLVPVAVALIPTIVVLGLFKAAGLKRAEDLYLLLRRTNGTVFGSTNARI